MNEDPLRGLETESWAHVSGVQGQSADDKLCPLHVWPHWNLSVLTRESVTIRLIHEYFIETTVQIILMCLDGIFFRNVKVSDEFLLVCLFFLFLL